MKSYVVKIYIEETSTRLAKRIGEHIGDLKGKEEKNAIWRYFKVEQEKEEQ